MMAGCRCTGFEVRVFDGDSDSRRGAVVCGGAGYQLGGAGSDNGVGYRFDVAAVNDLGAGARSAKTDPVTIPVGVPAAPTVKAAGG